MDELAGERNAVAKTQKYKAKHHRFGPWIAALLACLLPATPAGAQRGPFLRIASDSMAPTLRTGDFVFISPYGPRSPNSRLRPRRGDVAAFHPRFDPERNYMKRVIGMPGDRLQMIDGVLHLNGARVRLEALGLVEVEGDDGVEQVQSYRETLPNGVSYIVYDMGQTELDNTRLFVVPRDLYFVMGDHRDNSDDSRLSVGFVASDAFVGRVDHIMRAAGAR